MATNTVFNASEALEVLHNTLEDDRLTYLNKVTSENLSILCESLGLTVEKTAKKIHKINVILDAVSNSSSDNDMARKNGNGQAVMENAVMENNEVSNNSEITSDNQPTEQGTVTEDNQADNINNQQPTIDVTVTNVSEANQDPQDAKADINQSKLNLADDEMSKRAEELLVLLAKSKDNETVRLSIIKSYIESDYPLVNHLANLYGFFAESIQDIDATQYVDLDTYLLTSKEYEKHYQKSQSDDTEENDDDVTPTQKHIPNTAVSQPKLIYAYRSNDIEAEDKFNLIVEQEDATPIPLEPFPMMDGKLQTYYYMSVSDGIEIGFYTKNGVNKPVLTFGLDSNGDMHRLSITKDKKNSKIALASPIKISDDGVTRIYKTHIKFIGYLISKVIRHRVLSDCVNEHAVSPYAFFLCELWDASQVEIKEDEKKLKQTNSKVLSMKQYLPPIPTNQFYFAKAAVYANLWLRAEVHSRPKLEQMVREDWLNVPIEYRQYLLENSDIKVSLDMTLEDWEQYRRKQFKQALPSTVTVSQN